ncbi:MAG: polysaccharide biosynthesis C-terminal domain-containing protein [Verrucomicrobia bacterium]|nr:polysaccharide biosynthesis C-terminal domain-containing protein [Verrucomicrobiota bacterium]
MNTSHQDAETRILVNAASRYGATLFRALVSFVLTPFLIGAVGATMYGLQSLAGQILQFVALASTAIGFSYERFAAEQHARGDTAGMNQALSAGLILSTVSALVYLLCMGVLTLFAGQIFNLPPELLPTARSIFVLLGMASALQTVYNVWLAPIFIKERFYLAAVASIAASGLSLLAVWLAFRWLTPDIVVWVAISAGTKILCDILIVIPQCRRALPAAKPRVWPAPPKALFSDIVCFSAVSSAAALGHLLYVATDAFLITNLPPLGAEHIVYYNVAQRWDPQIKALVASFVGSLAPVITACAARGELASLNRIFIRATRYAFTVALFPCLVMMLYATPFFRYWLGEDFVDVCPPILRVTLVGFLLSVPAIVGFQILVACKRIGTAVTIYLVGGACNIVLSIWLVNVWGLGLMGIALGTTLSLWLARSITVPVLVRHHLSTSTPAMLRDGCMRALVGSLPMVALAGLLLRECPPQSLAGVLTHFACCGFVYALGIWRVALTPDDRRRAAAIFSRLRSRLKR